MFRVSVRSFVRNFRDFIEKNVGGGHMPRSSEVLKHRFQNFLQKKVEVLLSKQNEKCIDHFLDHFLKN